MEQAWQGKNALNFSEAKTRDNYWRVVLPREKRAFNDL